MFDSRFVIKDVGLELANLSLSEGMYFAFDSCIIGYDPNLETDFDNVVNGSAYSGDESKYMTGEIMFNDGKWNTSSVVDYSISGDNYTDMKNVINYEGNGFVDNFVISEYVDGNDLIPIRNGISTDIETRYSEFTNFFKIHSFLPIKKDESLPNSPYSAIKLTCLLDNNVGDFKINKLGLYVRKRTTTSTNTTNAFVDSNADTLVGFNNNPNIVIDYAKTSNTYNQYLQDPKYSSYNNFRNLLSEFTSSNVFSFDDELVEDELVLFAVLYMKTPIIKKASKVNGIVQNGFNKITIDAQINFELIDEETRANLLEILAYQDTHRDWYSYLMMQNIKDVSNIQNHLLDLQSQLSAKTLGSIKNNSSQDDIVKFVNTREELLALTSGKFGYVINDKQLYFYKSPTWLEIG